MRSANSMAISEATPPKETALTWAFRPTGLREIAASMANLMRSVTQHHGTVVSIDLVASINDTLRDWDAAGGAAAIALAESRIAADGKTHMGCKGGTP